MTFLSFFAGIGGFDLGFQQAGMECLGHIEINPDCQRVLERHWPGKLKGTDVTKYLNAPPRNTKPDLICGGFPCQDLSVAGKRKGLAGERSGLWFAFRDIIAELKPRWVVIENVPGLLSSHEGRDFALLLHGLAELDYRLASRVLDSQYVGVPQRRRRVFIVGSLGDGSSIEVLFEPESVCGDSPPSRAARKGTAATITTRTGNGSPGANIPLEGRLVEVAGTLGSSQGGFKTTDLNGTGAFIPDVCKTLTSEGSDGSSNGSDQGMPIIAPTVSSKWSKGSGGPSGDEAQNLITAPITTRPYADNDGREDNLVPVTEIERWRQTCGCGHSFVGRLDEPCPSCGEIREGVTHGDPIEPIPIKEYAKRHSGTSMNGVGHGRPGDPMFTLQASAEHAIAFHGSQDPDVSGDVTHPCGRNQGQETCVAVAMRGREGGAELEIGDDQAFALRASQGGGDKPMIAFDTTQITSGANRSNPKDGDPCHPLAAQAHPPAITKMGVRRLTPRECERLQGFPDDWTRWDADGNEISDSARYRMIGNAVTATVARWIGKKLMTSHTKKAPVAT